MARARSALFATLVGVIGVFGVVGLGSRDAHAGMPAPWTDRDDPELHLVEIGLAGGVVVLSRFHGLYRPGQASYKRFDRAAGELSLRLGYYPIRVVGVEVAGTLIPSRVETGDRATAYSIRGQLVGRLPYRVTPFLAGGLEFLGVASSTDALGNDLDVGGHVGGGLEIFVTHQAALRLGVTGMFHEGVGDRNTAHLEVNLGVAMVLGRHAPN